MPNKPNTKQEALLDSLYPVGQSATITLDLNAFQKHIQKYLAMEDEINAKGEVKRVAEKTEAPGVNLSTMTIKVPEGTFKETKVEKATENKNPQKKK